LGQDNFNYGLAKGCAEGFPVAVEPNLPHISSHASPRFAASSHTLTPLAPFPPVQEFGLYDKIWQAFAVFTGSRSVGVQGDQRTHSHVVALRAVTSSDGMTADWYGFEPEFLREVSTRICNQVRSVNRVVYDITSKPPGTIEWE